MTPSKEGGIQQPSVSLEQEYIDLALEWVRIFQKRHAERDATLQAHAQALAEALRIVVSEARLHGCIPEATIDRCSTALAAARNAGVVK